MRVKEILEEKGSKVWSIQAQQTLQEALRILVTHKIGAVLVFDQKTAVIGILSERDIMRECYRNPKDWNDSLVRKVMTSRVIAVTPEKTLEYVMELMTENRIRHIPVMHHEQLVGIVSIGDVVKARLKDSAYEIASMKEYLSST